MTPAPATIILHHGTTLHRAQRIVANGPDAYYSEPGSHWQTKDPPGFSAARIDRPIALGNPEEYARFKAGNFPNEGGPVILEFEVPLTVLAVLESDPDAKNAMDSGDTRFEPSRGLAELLAAWPTIVKRVRPI